MRWVHWALWKALCYRSSRADLNVASSFLDHPSGRNILEAITFILVVVMVHEIIRPMTMNRQVWDCLPVYELISIINY